MADPLPPRPAADRYRRPLAALALLGAGALLTGCAAAGHPAASGPSGPRIHRAATAPSGITAAPTPVRVLAVAYSSPTPAAPAPPGRAGAVLRAGAAVRRPHPAPGRPAAPAPQWQRPQPPAPAAAARGLPLEQPSVCELGRHYGGWPAGGAQEAACRAVYG